MLIVSQEDALVIPGLFRGRPCGSLNLLTKSAPLLYQFRMLVISSSTIISCFSFLFVWGLFVCLFPFTFSVFTNSHIKEPYSPFKRNKVIHPSLSFLSLKSIQKCVWYNQITFFSLPELICCWLLFMSSLSKCYRNSLYSLYELLDFKNFR